MGTELGSAAWIFIIIKFILYPLIMKIPVVQRAKERKAGNPGNPNSTENLNKVPGHAQECRDRAIKLNTFDGKLKTICNGLDELKRLNREDHRLIFEKLDKKVDK